MMVNGLYVLAEKVKTLREGAGMTQAELARRLDITRSSVNAWEMGIIIPSTAMVVELAKLFSVTSDYLLGLEDEMSIRTDGLSDKERAAVLSVVECLKDKTR